ncbi:MAG: polysaccharide biosynthesis/export family protein [Acidobacteriota bacterium]
MRCCRSLAALALWSVLLLAVEAAAQQTRTGIQYRIGPRDQIQVHVEEVDELNQEVTVADDGTINLPMIGTVDAQEQTETQLADQIRTRLEARGLRKATVTVSVTNYRSRPVSVLGAVGSPGKHAVPRQATLLDVLLEAGGVIDNHGEEIVVRRLARNGLSDEVRISIHELIEIGNPKVNLPIFAGDLINVPPARDLTILLIGEIEQTGSLTFPAGQRATLLTAMARAGGLTENASNKIRIQREDPSGGRTEIVVDFRRILNNRDPDVPLQDGDLIIVKESFF